MDTNDQSQQQTPMQATDVYPIEDRSLPADEVIAVQQSESADRFDSAPVFVP